VRYRWCQANASDLRRCAKPEFCPLLLKRQLYPGPAAIAEGIKYLHSALYSWLRYTVAPMGLKPGMQLGPYEIQERLGAGGMGEVYRARDSRLQRDVAINRLEFRFRLLNLFGGESKLSPIAGG
jgi:hypothetical protein